MQSRNPAARLGRWSAQHRKTAILGWILFVVLATVLGGKVGQNDLDDSARGSGESKRGDMIVEAAGFPDRAAEQVLVQGSGSGRAAAVRDVVGRLERIEGVTDIERPLASKDGRSVVVNFELAGDAEQAKQLVDRPLAAEVVLVEHLVEDGEVGAPAHQRGAARPVEVGQVGGVERGRGGAVGDDIAGPDGQAPGAQRPPEPGEHGHHALHALGPRPHFADLAVTSQTPRPLRSDRALCEVGGGAGALTTR